MKLAFVFPGQGSQSVGMLDSFADNVTVQAALQEAREALSDDIPALIAQGPAEQLNMTVNTQPAMLLSSVAMYRAWQALGGMQPAVMAGHSLGEYSALTAAGVFALKDALQLVRFRAQAMQEAVPVGVGGMAAIIGLSDEAVQEVCSQASVAGVVEPVNFNSPGQVVIAGEKAAIDQACVLAKQAGAKRALVLPVSAPFHSSLLAPARDALSEKLKSVAMAPAQVPVVANYDVQVHEGSEAIAQALAAQAAGAVQWVKTIEKFEQDGVTHIIECGPGRVLAGLIKRITSNIQVFNINSEESLKAVFEQSQQWSE